MNRVQLANELKNMWFSMPDGQRTPMLHLFGIRYAEHLKGWKVRELDELCEDAGLKASKGTEIHKMVKLSKFVVEKA